MFLAFQTLVPNYGTLNKKKGPLKNSDMISFVISMASNFGTQREKKPFTTPKFGVEL
jgi:hypothetical protein